MVTLKRISTNEKVSADDLCSMSKNIYEYLLKDFCKHILASSIAQIKATVAGNIVVQDTGTNYNIKVKEHLQIDTDGTVVFNPIEQTIQVPVPSADPRVDILEATFKYTNYDSQTKTFINPTSVNRIFSQATFTKFLVDADITVKQGVEGAGVAPTVTAGKMKIAELYVDTTGGIANADIFNVTSLYGEANTGWTTETDITKLLQTTEDIKAYADSLVVGLLDDRGNYDASGNVFPSTGGSGSGGAILKGDLWLISVAGTLGGVSVAIGDTIRALTDTPGQTAGNWAIIEGNFGYIPVKAPATNTDNYVPQWNGANSKELKDGRAIGTAANNLLAFDSNQYITFPSRTYWTASTYAEYTADCSTYNSSYAGTNIGVGFANCIAAGRIYGASWTPDYAEGMILDKVSEKSPQPGRVYVFTPKGLIRSNKKCQAGTMGIFSDTFGQCINSPGLIDYNDIEKSMKDKKRIKIPICLKGQVPVYVKEKIKCFQLLVSGKNGVATKANIFERIFYKERIIGMAIEESKDNKEKRIWIFR